MKFYEVYVTKMCHDLAGVIGTLGNTLELIEIDDSFVKEGTCLLKNSSKVLTARLKFFRAMLGLDTTIQTDVADAYLKTNTPLFTVNGSVTERIHLAFVLLASECLVRGGIITIRENSVRFEGEKILFDADKYDILTGAAPILKPQYTAVLFINEWLSQQQKKVQVVQSDNRLDFRIY